MSALRLLFVLLCCLPLCLASKLSLRLADSGDQRHTFFVDLLRQAAKAQGTELDIVMVPVPRHIRAYLAMQAGQLDAQWLLPSKERDQRFVRVDIPLTRGLIGKRVLLIAKGDLRFDGIHDLAGLRSSKLIAGLGRGWLDVAIWRHNALPLYEHNGDWNSLFKLLAIGNRGFDYFPRGASEVEQELAAHPELQLEPNLLLQYDSDFYFYCRSADTARQIDTLLRAAQRSGLLDRLQHQYFDPVVARLHLDKRIVIPLALPPASD